MDHESEEPLDLDKRLTFKCTDNRGISRLGSLEIRSLPEIFRVFHSGEERSDFVSRKRMERRRC